MQDYKNIAGFLKGSGLAFLGDSGTYAAGALLAAFELPAGILVWIRKQTFYTYSFFSFIIVMALVLAHILSGNWLNIMIHIPLVATSAGWVINEWSKKYDFSIRLTTHLLKSTPKGRSF